MLKKGILKRITISTLALFILLITYLFPTKIDNQEYKQTLTYNDVLKSAVYLLDKQELVARVDMGVTNKDIINRVKEIISILTIQSKESDYIPTDFYGIIPNGTKINNVTLENKLLKIDFSKEFLNTTVDLERKMIEAIIYSLTEMDEIDNILIFVDGSQLIELPFSKEKLPPILNKDFGVNTIYDFNTIKDTTKATIYYGSKTKDTFYYVPVTYVSNSNQEKVEIIIEKLKNSPIYESQFISYLNANANLTNYEILDNEIKLSFNSYLLDDLNKSTILEEVQYMIYLSLRDTYNITKVEFQVNDGDKNVNLVINSLE